jgi:pyridoxamine 5'-phosphate oxidase
MDPELAALRREYELGGLAESDLRATPVEMFRHWFEEARAGGVLEPNAMVLSTVSADGQPSSRTVLLKGVVEDRFWFFTNHDSRKGCELTANPRCALLFGWYDVQRQVRVEGVAEPLARADDEAYFASRPREAQLGAWASAQSREVASREELQRAHDEAAARFDGTDVPCPPYWGGYAVTPLRVEFWQGRRGRMHDRLVYIREEAGWCTARLAP